MPGRGKEGGSGGGNTSRSPITFPTGAIGRTPTGVRTRKRNAKTPKGSGSAVTTQGDEVQIEVERTEMMEEATGGPTEEPTEAQSSQIDLLRQYMPETVELADHLGSLDGITSMIKNWLGVASQLDDDGRLLLDRIGVETVSQLEREFDKLNKELKDAVDKANSYAVYRQKYGELQLASEIEIKAKSTKIREQETSIEKLNNDLRAARKAADQIPIYIDQIEELNKEHEGAIREKNRQIKQFIDENNRLESRIETFRSEINEHFQERAKQKAEIDRLKALGSSEEPSNEILRVRRFSQGEDNLNSGPGMRMNEMLLLDGGDIGSGIPINENNHRRKPRSMGRNGDARQGGDGIVTNVDAALYRSYIRDAMRLTDVVRDQLSSNLAGAVVTMEVINTNLANATSKQTAALTGLNFEQFEEEIEDYRELSETVSLLNAGLKAALETQRKRDKENEARSMRKVTDIQLPEFRGEYDQFHSWWKLFIESVDEVKNLTASEKYSFLVTRVKGAAASVFHGLSVSEASYEAAKAALEKRYGNTIAVIEQLMGDLEGLPTVKKREDIDNCIALHDKVRKVVRLLDDLGEPRESYDARARRNVLSALPFELKIEWQSMSENKSLIGLLKTLDDYISKLQQCGLKPKEVQPEPKGKQKSQDKTKETNKESSNVVTMTTSAKPKRGDPCVMCGGTNHASFKCRTGSYDDRVKKASGRCYVCLGEGHIAVNCTIKVPCYYCKKTGHCQALCRQEKKTKPAKKESSTGSTAGATGGESSSLERKDHEAKSDESSSRKRLTSLVVVTTRVNPMTGELLARAGIVLLPTATVIIIGPYGLRRRCLCLFDTGSQRSFISKALANELQLIELSKEDLTISSFGDMQVTSNQTSVRLIRIRGSYRDAKEYYLPALERDEIVSLDSYTPTALGRQMTREGRILADDRYRSNTTELLKVELLIGSDIYWQLVSSETRTDGRGLTAIDSRFGWLISGAVDDRAAPTVVAVNTVTTDDPDELDNIEFDLSMFWSLEHVGIIEPTYKEPEILAPFLAQIQMGRNGRFVTSLPKKTELFKRVPTYYKTTKQRLEQLLRRLRRDPKGMWEYHAQMMQYVTEGFVQVANPDFKGIVTYLPHHPVIREDSVTTKIRPVFDGSAKGGGCPSLNDALECGPNLNPELLAVLMRFRQFPIVWIADITKAFLQIELTEEDAEAVRFLWVDDPSRMNARVIEFRWNRVPFGLTCSPFILRAVLMNLVDRYEPERDDMRMNLLNQLYVDDWIAGANTTEEAKRIILEGINVLGGANMQFVKWLTNSEELRTLMPEQFIDQGSVQIGQSVGSTADPCKVLGMRWDTEKDEFYFDPSGVVKALKESSSFTKRQTLSIQSRLFDPMGLLSPVVMSFKIILRAIAQRKPAIKWDEIVPEEITKRWVKLIKSLSALSDFRVPRCVAPAGLEGAQVHVFCDASVDGLGTVAYVRTADGQCNLLASRSRISPPGRTMTLPRLELIACEMGAQLADYIVQAQSYKDCEFHMWTDAMVALAWIRGDPNRWDSLVRNRVLKIMKYTKIDMWRHVPGLENPADAVSRGLLASKLLDLEIWKHGPAWLAGEPLGWPATDYAGEEAAEQEAERCAPVKVMAVQVKEPGLMARLGTAAERYDKLKRIVAWGRRSWMPEPGLLPKNVRIEFEGKTVCLEPLSAQEIRDAGRDIIQATQKEAFPEEYEMLKSGRKVSRQSRLAPLRPSWDVAREVIVVTGRLGDVMDHMNQEYLILLPDHPVTDAIIREQHHRGGHLGWSTVLASIRTQFWPVRGRQQVKSLLRNCTTCAAVQSRRYASVPAHIPATRISEPMNPWEHAAVDLAGPYDVFLNAKDYDAAAIKREEWYDWWETLYSSGKRGRKRQTAAERKLQKRAKAAKEKKIKVWIALFSCGSTRAVHIEVMEDLIPSSFQNALRRFMAVRNCHPKVMYSDNGGTFARTSRQLETIFHDPKVYDYLANHQIEWKFSVSLAPWWNGWFERLIGVTKNTFNKIVGKRSLDLDSFRTLFHEVSKMVNDRPLTYVTNDGETTAITPAMLISGNRQEVRPDFDSERVLNQSDVAELEGRDHVRRGRLAFWWKNWTEQYLKELNNFGYERSGRLRCPKIGELVLVENEDKKRMYWKKGLVTKHYTNLKGEVHAVQVKVFEGLIDRALECLFPLELHASNSTAATGPDGAAAE